MMQHLIFSIIKLVIGAYHECSVWRMHLCWVAHLVIKNRNLGYPNSLLNEHIHIHLLKSIKIIPFVHAPQPSTNIKRGKTTRSYFIFYKKCFNLTKCTSGRKVPKCIQRARKQAVFRRAGHNHKRSVELCG